MANPEQKPLLGAQANAEAIQAMKETPASCNRFRLLYKGLQLRIGVPQPDAEMAATVSTSFEVWKIHKEHCSKGSVSAHFEGPV